MGPDETDILGPNETVIATQLRADTDRAREDAARQLSQARTDAERERDELRTVLDARAATLAEARDDLRARAQRAETDLDQARAELARLTADDPAEEQTASHAAPRRGRQKAASAS